LGVLIVKPFLMALNSTSTGGELAFALVRSMVPRRIDMLEDPLQTDLDHPHFIMNVVDQHCHCKRAGSCTIGMSST
jgi:hypothetical protein